MTEQAPLVVDVLSRLAQAVTRCLREEGEDELAEQIPTLRVLAPCPCKDDFCQSFYTAPHKPGERYDGDHRTVPLLPDGEMVNLDVVEGRIVHIEIVL